MDQTLHLLLPNPSFPLLPIPSPAAKSSPSPGRRRRPSLYLLRGHHHRPLPSPHFEVRAMAGGGSELTVEGAFCGNGAGSELPVELCLTRVLPPALTLEEGGRRIKEAVAEIRSCPPGLSSGIIRFQVGVPPSVKSLTWLLCQPHSSVGYPQFYLSGNVVEELSSDLVSQDEVYGVSGIGSAVYFTGSACAGSDVSSSIKRYLSVDSPLIRAYGFEGTYYDVKSSTMKHGANSCFFFIPKIELDEFEGISILAATMAWDECSFCTFEKAVLDFESSLYKAMFNVWPIGQVFYNKWIIDACEKSALINVKSAYLALLTATSLVQRYMLLNLRHLGDGSKFQYYIMFSRNVAFTSKMGCMKELNPSLEDCENVNILWASLIVEECIRLGLTYFCIAPGSRSSPLVIAASAHSLATCVSCYDERSLAFHAIGHVKGSGMAAIIITSSGTAASNLYPAVVEASQDFLPLILLTADRPPELQDAGANQSINQVNHFGSFVKFFFNIPPPTDEIPARMVLTTVDSAVHIAMQVPEGPVHVNCAFREPLANIPKDWSLQALHGLRVWALNLEPFTKYMRPHYSASSQVVPSQISHILDMIQGAKQGLLFVGAMHDEDEMWAALLLVRHLSWPVGTDILSGLRLRRALTSIQGMEENLVFIDHLDHILLSESFSSWFRPDVILHIGGKITSKRIAQMLESCLFDSYIMVDRHPYRHDPSHIVTHRIQSSVRQFTEYALMAQPPKKMLNWTSTLELLDKMVSWEISFQIKCQISLTEPHVAQVISTALPSDAAVFVGNSMVIRDMDFYGHGWLNSLASDSSIASCYGANCLGVRVVGNRGASGIDGLLSTAIGFSTACNKRVFCILGDISLIHDTNGFSFFCQRVGRKPVTVIVINNHGGAIFGLLPIANSTNPSILRKYFYTTHTISLRSLCEAHSVEHLYVQTKLELQQALQISQNANADYMIEVESSIEGNATFHRFMMKCASQAADEALRVMSCFPFPINKSGVASICTICKMEYSKYSIKQCAPLTSAKVSNDSNIYKDGFILTVVLDDGCVGMGEVAPIEIHKENIVDVEEQLRFLLTVIKFMELSYDLPLLRGSFSNWIWSNLGLTPSSLFPSVRCGLEMAILNALAATRGVCLAEVFLGGENIPFEESTIQKGGIDSGSRVPICALVDSIGSPKEVSCMVSQLVDEGFNTIKLKVGRRESPLDDVCIIREIRQVVGFDVQIRVDANRRWTYDEAILFGNSVKSYNLQYVEEPVQIEADILKFCNETGVPVALDETLDIYQENVLDKLQEFLHPGIVAIVIKPSVIGGFEEAFSVARWAHQHDKMAVISSCFESSISLATYTQFAYYIEQRQLMCSEKNKMFPVVAHGLGTYRWLAEDVLTAQFNKCMQSSHGSVGASVSGAAQILSNSQIIDTVQTCYPDEPLQSYKTVVKLENFFYSFRVHDTRVDIDDKLLIFFHGFLGTGEDWIPIMKAVSSTSRCISIDLPGHGQSSFGEHVDGTCNQEQNMSIEMVSAVLCKLISRYMPKKIILVGYSMGARIALYMALKGSIQISGAVIVSGSPGLSDKRTGRVRISEDDAKACYLLKHGLKCFVDLWYSKEMWKSLRSHPNFKQIIGSRTKHSDLSGLAWALSGLSIGRQPSLWEDLKDTASPLLFIVGEKDAKFKDIARQMCQKISSSRQERNWMFSDNIMEVIPDCGHAVHLENPLLLITAVRKFFNHVMGDA